MTEAAKTLSTVTLETVLKERETMTRETVGKSRSTCVCGYVSSSPAKKALVTIPDTTTVLDALQVLADNSILSAVVTSGGGKQYLGILNIYDLLLPIVFAPIWSKYEGKTLSSVTQQQFEEAQQMKIWSTPCSEVLGNSEESKNLWTVTDDVSVAKVAEYFCRGVHRVLVRPCPVPASAKPVAVMDIPKGDAETKHGSAVVTMGLPELLSQTDFALYLQKHRAQFAKLLYQSLQELGLAHAEHKYEKKGEPPAAPPKYNVVSVGPSVSALEAFRSLRDSKGELAAVPVLGQSGVLLSNLSASDLRGVTQNNAYLLTLPVMEFLVSLHGQLPTLVTCRASDSLNTVLDRILQNKVHRAWIVDSRFRVSGCVSLTDIISKISSADWKTPDVKTA